MEKTENENAVVVKLWDVAKAALRGKFMEIQAYLKNLNLQQKEVEKQQQAKPKPSRRKETINIKAEINQVEKKNRTDL